MIAAPGLAQVGPDELPGTAGGWVVPHQSIFLFGRQQEMQRRVFFVSFAHDAGKHFDDIRSFTHSNP